MREQYIPDLTERFPEGFDGIDLTDSYFPNDRRGIYETMFEYEFDKAIEELEKQNNKKD